MKLRSLIFVLFTIFGVGAQEASASVYVSGQVFRKGVRNPVAGATVQLFRPVEDGSIAVAQTLGNGSYILKAPHPGPYRIKVTAPHFLPFDGPVKVSKSLGQPFDISLTKQPTIMLLLSSPPGSPPIVGSVSVTTWTERGVWQAEVKTVNGTVGPDGSVELEAPAGPPLQEIQKLLVEVTSDHGIGQVLVDHWRNNTIKVPLSAGLSVSGEVVDAQGKPAVGGMVMAIRLINDVPLFAGDGPRMIAIGADGRFTVGSLVPGPCLLVALKENGPNPFPDIDYQVVDPSLQKTAIRFTPNHRSFRLLMQEFSLDNPRVTTLLALERLDPVRVAQMSAITGRVLDSISGKPIPGVFISLSQGPHMRDRMEVWDIAKSALDGTYRLRVIPSEKYLLQVINNRYHLFDQPITALAAGQTTADVSLTPLKTAVLKFVAADGKPITGGNMDTWVSVDGVSNSPWLNLPPEFGADGTIEITEPQNIPLPGQDISQVVTPHSPTGVVIGARSEKNGYAIIHLTTWPSEPITLTLKPGGALAGIVTDEAGKPTANVNVVIMPATSTAKEQPMPSGEAPFTVYVQTDVDGRFKVMQLPPGNYQAWAMLPGARQCQTIATVTAGVTEIKLQPEVPKAAPAPAVPAAHKPNVK